MIKKISAQIISIVAGMLLIGIAISYLFSANASQDAQTVLPLPELKPSVMVIPVEPRHETVSITANGVIEAASISRVNPRVTGHVDAVSNQLMVGNRINKGDHLISINSLNYKVAESDAKLALESARLKVMQEQARSTQALRDIASVNSSKAANSELAKRVPQLKEAEADFAAKTIALQQAKENMSHTRIVAPFDGVILSVNVNNGEWVNLDDDIFTLADPTTLELQAPLTNDQWELIDQNSLIGTPVNVTTNMQGKQLWLGDIKGINPVINEKTGSLAVIVGLINDKEINTLPIGVFSTISFAGKTFESSQWIPQTALLPTAEVWAVSIENRLSKIPVTILQYRDQHVLVSYDYTKYTPSAFVDKAQLAFIEGQTVDPVFVSADNDKQIFNTAVDKNISPDNKS